MIQQEPTKEFLRENLTNKELFNACVFKIDEDEVYSDLIDGCLEEIDVCGYKYPASQVFKGTDYRRFELERIDYLSSEEEVEEGGYISLDNGDTYYHIEDVLQYWHKKNKEAMNA